MNPQATTRRRFLATFSLGTAVSLCSPWQTRLLASAPPFPPNADRLRIRPSQYPVLAEPGGSLRLKFRQIDNALIINRIAEDHFVALNSTCTHQGCQVGKFLTANGYMRCPCHGSRYDLAGRVFANQPAEEDLAQYPQVYDAANDTLDIHIPGISLDVQILKHQTTQSGPPVVALRVETTSFCTYEIHFRSSLEAAPQPALFALVADGPFTLSQLRPETNQVRTVYLPALGDMGFFQLALILTDED